MWAMVVWTALSWAGAAPELPVVLRQTAPWRALRQADGPPPISDAEYAKVASGGVVTGLVSIEGVASKKAYGAVILDVPLPRIWGAINDESLHPKYTRLGYAELVAGKPCESGRHVFQYLPSTIPLLDDRWWVTIRTDNRAIRDASGGKMRELIWRSAPDGSEVTSELGKSYMAKGVPVGFTRGSWFVSAVNERQTLVEYYSWVDPGGHLSPSLMNLVATRGISTTFENMQSASADPQLRCTN